MYARTFFAVLILSSPAYGAVRLNLFNLGVSAHVRALSDSSVTRIGSMDGSYSEQRSRSSIYGSATASHSFSIDTHSTRAVFLGNASAQATSVFEGRDGTNSVARSSNVFIFNVDSVSTYRFEAQGSESVFVSPNFANAESRLTDLSRRDVFYFGVDIDATTRTAQGVIFPQGYEFRSSAEARTFQAASADATIDFSLRIKPLTCAEVIEGAVAMPQTIPSFGLPNAGIYTTFVPNFGLTIAQAAQICNVRTFNWVNHFVSVPDHWTIRRFVNDEDPRLGDDVTPRPGRPLVDPVLQAPPDLIGHYQVFSTHAPPDGARFGEIGSRDNLVFYFNEPSDPAFGGCLTTEPVRTAGRLEFCDAPYVPDIYFQKNDVWQFRTQLAGVGQNGEWVHLPPTKKPTGFGWKTNVQLRTDGTWDGKIWLQAVDDGTPVDIISGSIFEVQTSNESHFIPGDANLDGTVDQTDAAILARNIGESDVFWQEGDFDLDGAITLTDVALLQSHLGESLPVAAAIPEPGSAALVAIALGVILFAARCRVRRAT